MRDLYIENKQLKERLLEAVLQNGQLIADVEFYKTELEKLLTQVENMDLI
jgi:hypothetical protein